MRTRRFGGTVAASLALLVAGCGGGSATADPVAWTDEVCGALTGFTRVVTAQPQIDPADPVAAVRTLDGWFGSTTAELQRSIAALDAVGASPVDGGDQYVTRLREALSSMQAGFEDARTRLDTADTSSPAALAAAFPAVVAPLQDLRDVPDPTEGLQADDALRTAGEQAPNCRALRTAGAPAG
ncbi:hypothetical protein [Pseudonocardia nigra]|uniref:hypothetical protein n=1 Tax=Pseudonocardia nigra TaxID=1921578 RepID=UPI001C5DFFCE|nr:hypothetical protein [Pseudonocardia nigra]